MKYPQLILIRADSPSTTVAAAMMMRHCRRHCVALAVRASRTNPLGPAACDTGCSRANKRAACGEQIAASFHSVIACRDNTHDTRALVAWCAGIVRVVYWRIIVQTLDARHRCAAERRWTGKRHAALPPRCRSSSRQSRWIGQQPTPLECD